MPEHSAEEQDAQSATKVGAALRGTPLKTYLRNIGDNMQGPPAELPVTSTVAALLQHGGFQVLLTPGRLIKRLHQHAMYSEEEKPRPTSDAALKEATPPAAEGARQAARSLEPTKETEASRAAIGMQQMAMNFFQKLCPDSYYGIPSSLMSHLAFPHEGRTYTHRNEIEAENRSIPSAFTFVGQFVDHDLTFNGLNLFDIQTNVTDEPVREPFNHEIPVDPNLASPYIDLDNVYGRPYPEDPTDPGLKELLNKQGPMHVFCGCRFRLTKLGRNAYDLPRWMDKKAPDRVGSAWIYDPRNDENQLVLQIHILLMRVHNKLADMMKPPPPLPDCSTFANPTAEEMACTNELRKQVVCIWQSVLLNDFLPRVCKQEILDKVRAPGYQFHYKPDATGLLKMPHEFAIAFRFGHSMLRSSYKLNSGPAVPLFDNRSTVKNIDLRGSTELPLEHVIDWDVFFPKDESKSTFSLQIDSHVTPVVFDLPESAIPDDIKTEGNLPKRNLDRSRSIELGCGEDIACCLGIEGVLSNLEVEPDETKHSLFEDDVNVYKTINGKQTLVTLEPFEGDRDTRFKTPLWYYVLRESEVRESGVHLGDLGSTIVAEVIVQGIENGTYAYGKADCLDQELLPGKTGKEIRLRDLIDFVYED